jgi:hypothetical protein
MFFTCVRSVDISANEQGLLQGWNSLLVRPEPLLNKDIKVQVDKQKFSDVWVKTIDSLLHRNRIILMTLMGDSKKETFEKIVLTRAKFRFEFHTGHYINKEGKTYWLIYDYGWMPARPQAGSFQIRKYW